MNKIVLTTKLTVDDYVRVIMHLLYRRWAIKFFIGIGLFVFFVTLLALVSSPEQAHWSQLIVGLVMAFGLPIFTYFNARATFRSSHRIAEAMVYEFDGDLMRVKGESFYSELPWDKVYGVTESSRCILIWESKNAINIIPKRDFKSEEMHAFKALMTSLVGHKSKLRN